MTVSGGHPRGAIEMSAMKGSQGFVEIGGVRCEITSWEVRNTSTPIAEILRVRDLARSFAAGWEIGGGLWCGPGPISLPDILSSLHARSGLPRPRRLVNWFFPERN
jgi:hypothetical protein